MRNFAILAVMVGFAMAPAYAQTPAPEKDKGSKTLLQLEDEEKERRAKDIDKDYDAAIKRSRATTPKTSADPWKSVRQPGASTDRK